ncbi:MAG: Rieske 2Fe-2S domain-containing protein [Pseudomonadota bacterium]
MTRRLEIAPERLPPPGGRALLHTGTHCVVLFQVDGEYHAIDDRCPHQGASLAGGKLAGRSVQCPAHGLRFDLASGCMPQSPQVRVAVYPIHIERGRVFVCLPGEEEQT